MTRPTPWLLALAALTGLRLLAAAALPLSGDEAYYWTWSHALAPGYLDHPPMVALWMRAGTALAGEGALGLRLLGPLSAAAGTVLLARAADAIRPGAGLPAAALFNGTLLLGAGSVTMTPDTPLLFFWTLALWALARMLRSGQGRWWLLVGAASGLALCSKYTGGFLGVGIVLWLAWVPGLRRWFLNPWLWAGGAVAAALFAPVLAWNAGHGWASLAKQGGRAGDWAPRAALAHLAELLAGQAALATPLVFVLLAAGAMAALRGAWRRDAGWSLLAAMTLPGLLVFLHTRRRRPRAGELAGHPLPPAAAAAAGVVALGGWPARLWRPAAALGLLLTAAATLQAAAAPLAVPRRLDPALIRLGGWDGMARDADALARHIRRPVADGGELRRRLPARLVDPRPRAGGRPAGRRALVPAAPARRGPHRPRPAPAQPAPPRAARPRPVGGGCSPGRAGPRPQRGGGRALPRLPCPATTRRRLRAPPHPMRTAHAPHS